LPANCIQLVCNNLEVCYFSNAIMNGGVVRNGVSGAGRGFYFTVMLHYLISYQQQHALSMSTEPCWLQTGDQAACGAVILRFHRVSNL
jgi:hypothetical protein